MSLTAAALPRQLLGARIGAYGCRRAAALARRLEVALPLDPAANVAFGAILTLHVVNHAHLGGLKRKTKEGGAKNRLADVRSSVRLSSGRPFCWTVCFGDSGIVISQTAIVSHFTSHGSGFKHHWRCQLQDCTAIGRSKFIDMLQFCMGAFK